MKRRRLFQMLAAAPAAPAALAQQSAAGGGAELPKIANVDPETAADPLPRFFSPVQMETLQALSRLMMPAANGAPGALEAGVPAFLDFLISQSPADRQQLYRRGLDTLHAQAQQKFRKSFSQLTSSEAAALLTPLNEPWTFDPPADPFANFLRQARQDIRTATTNSKEWSAAGRAGGGRRGGSAPYFLPLD